MIRPVLHPLLLLIPVFLPVAGGYLIILLHIRENRIRDLWCEVLACVTSLLTWGFLLFGQTGPATVFTFTPGFSICLEMDGLGAVFAGMVSVMWPVVLIYSFSYMEEEENLNRFFCFYMMTYGVTLGVAFSANMTTLYVFYEMLSLVTIPLVFHYEDHDSLYAGRKYLTYTIGGASLALITVVITTVYGKDGSFIYGGSLLEGYEPVLMKVVFLLGFFGFGVKAAIFPLHSWLPTASVAPTPVTALLHAVAVVNTGVFAVIRMVWYVIGPGLVEGTVIQAFCTSLAAFTLVFAACMAVKERHFKRRLAYSTVSNLSYMLYGVMLLTPEGLEGGIAHMVFHGFIKIALFMCAGSYMHVTRNRYVYELNGIGRRMPHTFLLYTVSSLALVGFPLFSGFVSKWLLLEAGARQGSPAAIAGVVALIISAFLCAVYTLTVSVRAFFPVRGKERVAKEIGAADADLRMLIPIAIFTAVNVLFGVAPGLVTGLFKAVAHGIR